MANKLFLVVDPPTPPPAVGGVVLGFASAMEHARYVVGTGLAEYERVGPAMHSSYGGALQDALARALVAERNAVALRESVEAEIAELGGSPR